MGVEELSLTHNALECATPKIRSSTVFDEFLICSFFLCAVKCAVNSVTYVSLIEPARQSIDRLLADAVPC